MGSTLSTSRLVARRRRKTTSAVNVDYCQLNVTTSRHKSSVSVPRFLSVLTGRKSVAVARQPAVGDVISGDDAKCRQKHNNDSGYDEVRLYDQST